MYTHYFSCFPIIPLILNNLSLHSVLYRMAKGTESVHVVMKP